MKNTVLSMKRAAFRLFVEANNFSQSIFNFARKSNLIVIAYVAICLISIAVDVYAVDDMWTVAEKIIQDVYTKIAAISTALACAMTAVAVISVKLSSNQHKSDNAYDWLKRIWGAWAIVNGIGAFIVWIKPKFDGLGTTNPALPATPPTP